VRGLKYLKLELWTCIFATLKHLETLPNEEFDILIIGSGFAGSFFLKKTLEQKPNLSILVVERGAYIKHWDRVQQRITSHQNAGEYYINRNPELKDWGFSIGFGGSSNCWTGNTPRLFPDDFKVKSLYDFGVDWPLSYNELEPYYTEVERIMEVAGGDVPYPKSEPYPLMNHRLSPVDLILKEQHPSHFFPLPSARATEGGNRAACCSNGVCNTCPIDAKFTIENGCKKEYSHPNVSVICNSEVQSLLLNNERVTGVVVDRFGKRAELKAKTVVLAANGLFNPYILLKSGLNDGVVGRGITEQQGYIVDVKLGGIDNYQGGSIGTGWYTKGMKRDSITQDAAFMIHTENITASFRLDVPNPLKHLRLIISIEDFRVKANSVKVNQNSNKPEIIFTSASTHTKQTESKISAHVADFLSGIKHEIISIQRRKTEWHLQCSTPMGTDTLDSVVDKYGRHHRISNLIVLGSGNFPTAPPSNPTLTLSALAMYSADYLIKNSN